LSKRFFIPLLVLTLATIVVVFSLVFGKNSITQQRRLTREITSYQTTIDSLQKIIDERNLTIQRLRNDSLYIEEQLRVKYGMSRKGERVFQFVK